MAQRQVNAADKFISSVMEQFGLSKDDATKAWNYYLKNKLVSVDSVGGQYNLKDGRLWNGDSMRVAAKQDEPADQRKADLEKRKAELLAKRAQLADTAGRLAAAGNGIAEKSGAVDALGARLAAARPDTAGATAKVDDAAGRMKAAAEQSVADRRAKLEALRGRLEAAARLWQGRAGERRQQAEAQHIEGKTVEPVTAPVIAESIAKGARNTGTDLRKEHAALLAEIDAAIAKAPTVGPRQTVR
ncbi:MAG: hypothetical protein IPK44_24235 [Candidatus Accumulibacter sp.]|uniref:hypothetical protein n=1 Tax=Accumulibacter sp. TaxID=2053492 RepID=UPI00258B589E|nr:hypothetical protein [Accumulibacter sp.]MBK8117399.1 hypothetical protein [Accumulibacter sp.]